MTPAQAAWVAQHVIADYHLANDRQWWCGPAQTEDLRCRCQLPCITCQAGQHQLCRELLAKQAADPALQAAARVPETYLRAPRPFWPQQDRTLYVRVWLADRACRSLCHCTTCHPAPAPIAAPAVGKADQLGLFDLAAP